LQGGDHCSATLNVRKQSFHNTWGDSLYMMSHTHAQHRLFSVLLNTLLADVYRIQTVRWYTVHGICKLQLWWWFRTPALNEFLHIRELLLCHATVILVTSFLKIGMIEIWETCIFWI
jgi:hypothetical protein